MSKQIKALLQATTRSIASSRPGTWLFARILRPIDSALLKITHGRKSITQLIGGTTIVQLTTTGAKSGLPRTLPLIAVIDPQQPDKFALVASNWGQAKNPAWYYNLKANPRATCTFDDGQAFDYVAHEAHGPEYEHYWTIANSTYGGYQNYQDRNERRKIPLMILSPLEQA